jgi:hypothetical protein
MRLGEFAGGAVVVFLELLVLLGQLCDLPPIFLAFLDVVALRHLLLIEFVSGPAEAGDDEQDKQRFHEGNLKEGAA